MLQSIGSNDIVLSTGLYEVVPLEDELASVCLCVTAKYNVDDVDKSTGLGKDIYFFEDGTVVFWNIPGTVHPRCSTISNGNAKKRGFITHKKVEIKKKLRPAQQKPLKQGNAIREFLYSDCVQGN